MCKVSAKQRMKYCASDNDEIKFKDIIKRGGFVKCGWDGNQKTEQKIKEETKATIRCIPFDEKPEGLTCVYSGKLAKHEVIYACLLYTSPSPRD